MKANSFRNDNIFDLPWIQLELQRSEKNMDASVCN